MIRILTIAASLLALTAAALAQEECAGPAITINDVTFKLATVTAQKTFFHDESNSPRKAFVV